MAVSKRLITYSGIGVLVAGLVWYFTFTGRTEQRKEAEPQAQATSWTWENPYTFKKVVIPPGWKKVENDQLRDAVLALQHESGKCLIYITYDESVNNLSLPEYINAVKPMNQKEFGIDDFKKVTGKNGWVYYLGEGAKYMGKSLVNVDIRIWSDGSDGFWETVVTVDMEYKSIEYTAGEIVQLLAETTL